MASDFHHDVGQLLWVGIDGPDLSPAERTWLDEGKAGVIVLFARNLKQTDGECDLGAVQKLNESIHGIEGDNQILVAVDQEGGRVQRVRAPLPKWPPMLHHDELTMEVAEETAHQIGRQMGAELRWLGFDIDFAPVLDIHTREDNPIIGDRAFSRDPMRAARCGLAFAKGLSERGVLGCGKHFPGHGDTDIDSHLALPLLRHDMERLEKVELVPFYEAAKAGLPMMMTAHVVFTEIAEGVPATLAPAAIDLLRDKIGYTGVIVSDDLDMKAVADEFEVGEAAVLAVRAGCDALLLCRDKGNQRFAFEALLAECEKDVAFRERVATSARRIQTMKDSHFAARAGMAVPETLGDIEVSPLVEAFLALG